MRIAFLNCHNLYDVDAQNVDAPATLNERDTKIANLAATLQQVFRGTLPDIIGLCEVGSYGVGRQLRDALVANLPSFRYSSVWSGLGPNVRSRFSTGLMTLYNPDLLERLREPLRHSPAVNARTQWLAVPFRLKANLSTEFWFVANHWKSAVNVAPEVMQIRHMQSARQLGEFYLELPTRPMLLIGDFNCEPFDTPFCRQEGTRLKALRERRAILTKNVNGCRGAITYFYNPAWRLLGDPDHYEIAQQPGYTPSRPPGTYLQFRRRTGWQTLDQMLVSRQLLDGGQITLRESSAHIVSPHNGCSDHCAIGWEFDVARSGQPS